MPYNHAGEIGDVWKHLPLCDILKIEKPVMYHESNSAYSGYDISHKPQTEYGVFRMLGLDNHVFKNSEYYMTLKRNGIDNYRYTGSPGLAMEILSDKATYFFHDLEKEALNDVEAFAGRKGLGKYVKTFCGDSVSAFMDENCIIGEDDFIFLDPYSPFDIGLNGLNFFDVFNKAVAAKSKVLLWYGYENLTGRRLISERLKRVAYENKADVFSFDVWIKSMDADGCKINPGVPGCGLACAYMSNESVAMLEKYLFLIKNCYAGAAYCGNEAALLTGINKYSQ